MKTEPFSSLSEFLNHIINTFTRPGIKLNENELKQRNKEIKDAWTSHLQSNPDSIYGKIKTSTKDIEKTLNIDSTTPRYNEVVQALYSELLDSLQDSIRNIFDSDVAFSALETKYINAQVFQSPGEKYFAVIVNSSLIELLHKLGKLDTALMFPGSVVYCNRYPREKITSSQIESLRLEYYAHFQLNKRSHGPLLQLDDKAMHLHISGLTIKEKFIICHELGHILNGDFLNLSFGDHFFEYINNKNHRKEYMADIFGFLLLLESMKENSEISSPQRLFILSTIIQLFDVFWGLQKEEKDLHPDPLNRLLCITEHFYGPKFTPIVRESYSNKNAINQIVAMINDVDSIEKVLLESLNKWILVLNEKKSDIQNH